MKMYLIRETWTIDRYNDQHKEEARKRKKVLELMHPDRKYEIVEEVN